MVNASEFESVLRQIRDKKSSESVVTGSSVENKLS